MVEKVRDAFVAVLVPTIKVNTMGEALGTFIAWPTHMIKAISKNYQVYLLLCFTGLWYKTKGPNWW